MTELSPPLPPPPPVQAPGPQAWESTSAIDPQPQLLDPPPAPPPSPPFVPPTIWGEPQPDEHIGGVPDPGEDFDLEEAPTPEQIREAKRVYTSKKTRVTHRAAQFARGEITVKDLDDEELKRGRFRDSDGRFRGRAASKIPVEFHEEVMRRLLERGAEEIRKDYLGAIDTITDIMYDDTLDAAIRLRAADMVITRVAGKAVDKVEMSVEVKPWQQTLKGIIRTPPVELGIIDAVVVDDDDGDDDVDNS